MSTPVPPHADRSAAFDPGPGGGLTDDHFREVVRLVRLLPGRWLIERCEDDLGIVSVLLVQDVEGTNGVVFVLFRHAREINLDLRHGERFEPLGTFRTVRQAMDQVMAHVLRTPPGVGQDEAPADGTH